MKELLCLTFMCVFLTIGVIGDPKTGLDTTLKPTADPVKTAAPTQAPVKTTTAAPTNAPVKTTAAPTNAPVKTITTAAPAKDPSTPASNTTVAPSTPASNTTVAPSTPGPNSTVAPSTPGPNSTVVPSTPGPNSTVVPSTPGPNSTVVPSTPGPNSTVVPSTPGPNSTVVPSTPGPNSTVVPSTPGPNSTVAPTTSTIAPTPSKPPADKYMVNGTNDICIVMIAAIKFSIPYEGTKQNLTYEGSIGKHPIFNGTCSAKADTLKITDGAVTLEMTFKSHDKQYSLTVLELTAKTKHFKSGKDMTIVANYTNEKTFQLNFGDYYSCQSETTLHLSSGVDVFITDLKLEAFRNSTSTDIGGKRVICLGDQQTNSIVPIAVGAALAGLVVVVLIAYLIGRKRSRRGYESV